MSEKSEAMTMLCATCIQPIHMHATSGGHLVANHKDADGNKCSAVGKLVKTTFVFTACVPTQTARQSVAA